MKKLTRNSFPGILCGIFILVLTGLPGSVFPEVKPIIGMDKVVHMLMFATFAFLCIWGYRKQFISNSKTYRKRALWLTIIVSIAYSGLTELMQEFLIPSRFGDWFDFFSDAIGALLGTLFFYLFFKNRK